MNYLVLLIGDGEQPAWDTLTEEEQAAAMQQHDFCATCAEREGCRDPRWRGAGSGRECHGDAYSRWEGHLTEGPYAEALGLCPVGAERDHIAARRARLPR